MLSLQDIHVYYGKSYILQGASLEVNQGEVLALLGRNGVGKTTTLRAIMGMAPPSRGSIKFSDHELTELPSHRIPRLGIGYVPQGRRIFPRLTVLENIQSAVVVGNVSQENLQEAFDYFPRLRERIKQPGGTLSGGEQQMLAMARAMITNPKLMILDEPTEGLMPIMVDTIRDSILKLNRGKGTTVLLVEQNLDTALAVADRVCVMEKGVIKYSGGVKELDKDKLLAYLGV